MELNKTNPPRLSRIESISNSSQINLDKTSDSESMTNSFDGMSLNSIGSNWNISNSIDSEFGDAGCPSEEPFTSDIEKRSLLIRHMRRHLIRQDTATGNFAPADYHIN